MAILKTYSISGDITAGLVLLRQLHDEIEDDGCVTDFDGLVAEGDDLKVIGSAMNEATLDGLVLNHVKNDDHGIFRIEEDAAVNNEDHLSINYKTELKSGINYTPVYIIHDVGENAGLLDKTEYYRGFVDENNKGELILVVEESYTIDNSDPTLDHTAKPMLERTKTWKHVRKSDGQLEEKASKKKVKGKKYNTRRKRHIEGIRRRENVVEQLIDNVGLGGVLSGAFTDESDAHDKLTSLQELHAAAFSGWKTSGRGSLVNVIQNDATTAWLDTVVPDNGTTQAMCPWMINLSFRAYIQDKLKGNVK